MSAMEAACVLGCAAMAVVILSREQEAAALSLAVTIWVEKRQ